MSAMSTCQHRCQRQRQQPNQEWRSAAKCGLHSYVNRIGTNQQQDKKLKGGQEESELTQNQRRRQRGKSTKLSTQSNRQCWSTLSTILPCANDHHAEYLDDGNGDDECDNYCYDPYSSATSCPHCRSSRSNNMKNSLPDCHYSNTTSTTSPLTTITTDDFTTNSADISSWKEEAHWLSFQYEVTRFLKNVDKDEVGEESEEEILLNTARHVIENNKKTQSQRKRKTRKQRYLKKSKRHLKVHRDAAADTSLSSSSSTESFSILEKPIRKPLDKMHQYRESASYHDTDDNNRLVHQQQKDNHHFEQHFTSTLQQQPLQQLPQNSNSSFSPSDPKQKHQLTKRKHEEEEEELSKNIAELKLELAMLRAQRDEMEFDLWKG